MKSAYNPIIGYLKALGILLMVFGHSESGIPHTCVIVSYNLIKWKFLS